MAEWFKNFGLTQEEFDGRPVIAMGDVSEELRPPYRDEGHARRAGDILRYVNSVPNHMFVEGNRDIDIRSAFGEVSVVEVVGGYPEICVRDAIGGITKQGVLVFIDSRRLLGGNSSIPDVMLGRKVAQEGSFRGYLGVNIGPTTACYYSPQTIRRVLR